MSGITAHFVKESQYPIHVFYNTKNLNLGVALKATSGGDPNVRLAALSSDQTGFIPERTNLDSTLHNGMRLIVGLSNRPLIGGKESTEYDVSILSPVYQPISKTSNTNKAISAASNGQKAWVYYFSGANDGDRCLNYITLPDQQTKTAKNAQKPRENGCLASWYSHVEKTAYTYYQSAGSTLIQEYNQNSQGGQPIDRTNSAAACTAISVVYVDELKRVYLYFWDGEGQLNRVWRPVAYKMVADWKPAEAVPMGAAAEIQTQIGVVADPDGKQNHIFYNTSSVMVGTPDFTHVRDEWEKSD
ncbi:hypothetical protein EDC01DRAFT_791784 [Geopyxis carbonaria]|nr:hypothetical protein EDC01DRAFT_791784 [Geopyxis carbonaria]